MKASLKDPGEHKPRRDSVRLKSQVSAYISPGGLDVFKCTQNCIGYTYLTSFSLFPYGSLSVQSFWPYAASPRRYDGPPSPCG